MENSVPLTGRLTSTAPDIVGVLFALAFVLFFSAPVAAHTDFSYQVAVDHALLRPAKAGDNALLKLRIQNRGTSIIHLLRVESPITTGSRIIFDDGRRRSGSLESVAILPGEELDLASSHMWIELLELTEPLRDGQHVPLRLVFAFAGWVDVTADVGAHHEH